MTPSRNFPAPRLLGAIAGVTLVAGALAACGPVDSAEFEPDGQAQDAGTEPESDNVDDDVDADTSAEEDEDQDGSAEGADDGDGAAGAEPSEISYVRGPDEAVQTITYEVPDRGYEVTMGFHTLQVEGEVMRLELSFTPEGNGRAQGLNHFNPTNVFRPVLTDRENFKQYTVLQGDGSRWASSSGGREGVYIESGQTLMYYAYYAAPEDDIETMTITAINGLVEFPDAQIEW